MFLNEYGTVDAIGWTGDKRSKLWRYNQHYFQDLNAISAGKRNEWHRNLLDDWLKSNTPFEGEGWEPYPCSLRIVNLVKWMLSGGSLPSEHLVNLGLQARWLKKNLETHILGNHLLANAKALIFAGCYFDDNEADDWFIEGQSILSRELDEQILEDGAHFEISPMYHRTILEDLLDILNLSGVYPKQFSSSQVQMVKKCIPRMIRWMEIMSHPDGEVAFFNDTAMGIAPRAGELKDYAIRVGVDNYEGNISKQEYLRDSGYFRWTNDQAVLIGDVGRIGPDYIPGHGHADALSFEFSIGKQRVLVNSGTSLYEETKERLRQRGTSAHNTVEVDGENSSEVWKSFRVARRANPFGFQIKKQSEEWIQISCSHDGYRRLTGRNTHCRFWRLERGRLVVRDEIQGPFMSAVARFYLHPNIKITGNSLLLPNGITVQFTVEGGQFQFIEATWHPEFGKSTPTKCIVVKFLGPEIQSDFIWT